MVIAIKQAKLSNALTAFVDEMRLRLAAKEQEGKLGWDDSANIDDTDIIEKMQVKLDSPVRVNLIDLANYAMILWYREKNQ